MHLRTWAVITIVAGSAWAGNQPRYKDSGELVRPANYRQWIFLTSGSGMTYGPAGSMAQDMPPLFDNVFVNPEAYGSFVETGRWPDKTVFILEIRYSQSHGSINKGGRFQTEIAAMEAAVKDEQRFQKKWAYFDFATVGGSAAPSAPPLPERAGCYACHSTNGAVENTFVQFYPTLLEIAEAKGTLKPSFHGWTPSPARMYHTIATDGWTAGRAAFDRARYEEPDALALREPALERLGKQLLRAGKKAEAVSALEYATKLHPQSARLQDTLSNAYEASGRRQDALEVERRALELLSGDHAIPADQRNDLEKSARERIQRLEQRR